MKQKQYEPNHIRKQLENELVDLQFNGQDKVLQRSHPKNWMHRAGKLWNKEIEIPLLPLASVLLLVISISIGSQFIDRDDPSSSIPQPAQTKVLVDTGVGIYTYDVLEKAVGKK